jgi:hypothetical protein
MLTSDRAPELVIVTGTEVHLLRLVLAKVIEGFEGFVERGIERLPDMHPEMCGDVPFDKCERCRVISGQLDNWTKLIEAAHGLLKRPAKECDA